MAAPRKIERGQVVRVDSPGRLVGVVVDSDGHWVTLLDSQGTPVDKPVASVRALDDAPDRESFAPAVAARLRHLAREATRLADELDAEPGVGLGLSWGRVFHPAEMAMEAMRRYQNELS